MRIRVETESDRAAVEALHGAAFGDATLPVLVRGLRAGDGFVPSWSLVAEDGGEVVGHTMLTRIPLEADDGTTRGIACLSPLGVRPDAQGRGVGRALVEAACAAAEADGEPFVVLEGNPAMYSRFGFVRADGRGLRRPSERIPAAAFQVRPLAGDRPDDPALRGRVLYPEVFWQNGAVGRPLDRPAFLDVLERACRVVEQRCRTADGAPDAAALAAPVPACPGWTVADVVAHLAFIHRFVAGWVTGGRRPRPASVTAPGPGDPALLDGFAAGWRALQVLLDERGFATPTATWSPWDATAGFWFRRMAHEALVHALDVVQALPHQASLDLTIGNAVAEDGVDEVVRLWLGTRLGAQAGGDGQVVRLTAALPGGPGPDRSGGVAGERVWTVGLHGGITETHDVPTEPDAAVTGPAVGLYLWLWGRAGSGAVDVTGDAGAVTALRAALDRALQ